MFGVFSPTRNDLQRWSQSFDQLMRSARTWIFTIYLDFLRILVNCIGVTPVFVVVNVKWVRRDGMGGGFMSNKT